MYGFSVLILLVLLVFAFVITSKLSRIQETLDELKRTRGAFLGEAGSKREESSERTMAQPQIVAASSHSADTKETTVADKERDKYADVVVYIEGKIKAGNSVEEITSMLEHVGWSHGDIVVALSKASIVADEYAAKKPEVPEAKHLRVDIGQNEYGEDPMTQFFKWLAHDWLMKLGAFLIILAFGWFVSYSFAQNWIGPAGRVAIGIVLGVLIIALGEWRIKEYKNQGAVLLALGSGGVLITIFSARAFYEYMFSSTAALLFMFIVVAYLGLSSVRYKSKALAVLTLVLGYMVPILTQPPQPDFVEWFLYLLAVSGGMLWVAALTGWRPLVPFSLGGMFVYSAAAFTGNGMMQINMEMLFILSLVFAAMYFVVSMAAMVVSKKADISDLFTAAGVGAFSLMWVLAHIAKDWWSLWAVLLALVFSVGAFAVFRLTSMREPFYVYGSLALVFVGIATALELDGPTLTLVAIAEVAMVVALIKGVLRDTYLAQCTSLLMVIPGALSLPSIFARSWNDGIMHGDFVVLVAMAIALAGLGVYFGTKREAGVFVSESGLIATFVFAALYVMVLIWRVPYALFEPDTALMIILTLHTVIGLYFYLSGSFQGNSGFKLLGGLFIGFVIMRLMYFAVDLDTAGRVVIFTIIGVLLMSTAFIGRSKKSEKSEETKEIEKS